MEEGCGATWGDNFHFTAAAWTFYQHLVSLLRSDHQPGGWHAAQANGGRGWGELTNQGPGHSGSQLLTTNFIAIAEIMLV